MLFNDNVAATTWLLLSAVVALIAVDERRNGVRWFVYGMFAWPIALPHILILKALYRHR